MFEAVPHPYLVPFDGSFRQTDAPTAPPEGAPSRKKAKKALKKQVKRLAKQQRILYAHDHHAILLVFQAMDAAGKDGTIRAVLSGVNPAGCQVYSFKKPTAEELDHDFLWRTTKRLPERGRIGVFNRSYYEEVLVVKVHPEYLVGQRILGAVNPDEVWPHRYESIRNHEAHLARNGTVILKFWLNVSKEEQRQRFLDRLNEPEKNWKFAPGDVYERRRWDDYMAAYETALKETSRPWAPWYAIPADNKRYMRLIVAQIIADSLDTLQLTYPTVAPEDRVRFDTMRMELEQEAEHGPAQES